MTQGARAALLNAYEYGTANASGSFHLTANGGCRTVVALVTLPPGRRAAELGRSILSFPRSPEWRAAGLGDPVELECEVPNWVAELLFWAGRERFDGRERIPGPMDVPLRPYGGGLELAVDALTEELAPMRDEGVHLWKANESPLSSVRKVVGMPKFAARFGGSFLKEWKEALGDLAADLRSEDRPVDLPRPADATHPPIEGIGYEHWIHVKALLARDEVHPAHVDLYTHYRHVPWQRWQAIDAAWTQRRQADPQLAAWADYDFRRMKPTGASWEVGY